MQGGLSSANTERFQSPFERSDPPLEHCRRRIADPAIAISFHFEIEETRPMLGTVECIGHSLIYRPLSWDRRRSHHGRQSSRSASDVPV